MASFCTYSCWRYTRPFPIWLSDISEGSRFSQLGIKQAKRPFQRESRPQFVERGACLLCIQVCWILRMLYLSCLDTGSQLGRGNGWMVARRSEGWGVQHPVTHRVDSAFHSLGDKFKIGSRTDGHLPGYHVVNSNSCYIIMLLSVK